MADVIIPRTDERVPEAIAPRALVPSERQIAEGAKAPPDIDATTGRPVAAAPEQSRAQRVREHLAAYDPRTIEGPKRPLVVFSVVALFAQVDIAVFSVVLPELRAEFGGQIGPMILVGTVVTLVSTALRPVFGFLVDRVNRVRLVQLSNIGSHLVGLMAPLTSRSLVNLVFWNGSSGIVRGVASIESPAPASLLTDYYETESASRVLVFLPAVTALAGVFTPVIAGWSVDNLGGWRQAALLLGGIATGVNLVTLLLKEPPRRRPARLSDDEAALVRPPTFGESLRAVKGIYTMRKLWAGLVFISASTTGFLIFLSLYWAEVYGLTPSQRGFLNGMSSGVAFIALLALTPWLGKLAVTKPSRILVIFGGVVAVSAMWVLVMVWTNVLAVSIVASVWPSVAAVAVTPALVILVLRLLPVDIRGFGLGTLAPSVLLGQLLFYLAVSNFPATAAGTRNMALTFVPFNLIGGYLLLSAAGTVDRDVRAAEAATAARRVGADTEAGQGTFLVCRDVEVDYRGTTVLDRVSLDIAAGELVALLGTNGAGKSTLLKVICGVVPASSGAIYFGGRDITHEPPHLNVLNGVVMVPGGRAVFPTLTVAENLRAAAVAGTEDPDSDGEGTTTRRDDVLRLFPVLADRLHQRAGDLSGGEQQMVALGQAMLMKPRLLMIDELSLGLAPAVVEQLLDALRRINEAGTTVVIVEQSVNVALTIASRAVFMDKGAIQFDGRTEELLARPDLVRSVFMGGAATAKVTTLSGGFRRRASEVAEVLAVQDVAVSFGNIHAVQGVSFSVEPGEILGVLGPNGAGKTTVFDAISGFVPLSDGVVRINGIDVGASAPDARARLGLARSFQDARLFASMTVRENIAVAFERLASKNPLAAMVRSGSVRRSEDRIARRVDGLIDLLGLGPYADKFVAELSTGSRRAVDVAVVMAAEPKVLLLDEPSSGLAQAEVETLGPVIHRLARETGAGVVVIEHDLPLLASVSNRLVAMERGRVIAEGPPDAVLADQRVLASYLNASERVLARSGDRMASIVSALGVDPAPTKKRNAHDDH